MRALMCQMGEWKVCVDLPYLEFSNAGGKADVRGTGNMQLCVQTIARGSSATVSMETRLLSRSGIVVLNYLRRLHGRFGSCGVWRGLRRAVGRACPCSAVASCVPRKGSRQEGDEVAVWGYVGGKCDANPAWQLEAPGSWDCI